MPTDDNPNDSEKGIDLQAITSVLNLEESLQGTLFQSKQPDVMAYLKAHNEGLSDFFR